MGKYGLSILHISLKFLISLVISYYLVRLFNVLKEFLKNWSIVVYNVVLDSSVQQSDLV